jgi:adenine phosphoribosyltransferase
VRADRVLGIEARGFIIAAPVAYRMGAALCRFARPASCRGPSCARSTRSSTASDKLEIHRDAIHPGERSWSIDDVLATGGTAAAHGAARRGLGGSWSVSGC